MAPGSPRIIDRVKPFVPTAVKQQVFKRVPLRYRHLVAPDWHRKTIRTGLGHWEYLGQLQLDYLKARGLEPHHDFLDVGCGPLRAGVLFIAYLDKGKYAGIDKRDDVLEVSRLVELQNAGVEDKEPALLASETFEFGKFNRTFDYAIAQSVFTHLNLNAIRRCLIEMGKVLNPGGRFYATIHLNPHDNLYVDDIVQPTGLISHYDRDFYHYDMESIEWACAGTGLTVTNEGEWGHPNNSKMLVFTRNATHA